jgi:hypothetical protein
MRRATNSARTASAAITTATSGTAVPARESEPQDVQRPTASDPIRVAVEQEGQAQVSMVIV